MKESLPQQWLDRADEDLTVARLVFREHHFSHACFLAQQCIEKTLKAFLLARKNSYPRAHKLVDLLSECVAIVPELSGFRDDCLVIDQYYVPTRYPNGVPGSLPGGLPTNKEAAEAIASAGNILSVILRQLGSAA